MPDSSTLDSTSNVESSRKRTVNFSRPRIFKDYVSNERKDSVVTSPPAPPPPVKSVSAIYEPPAKDQDEEPLPDEPRFSIDTLYGAEAPDENYRQESVGSQTQWQTSRGIMTMRSGPQLRDQEQRHPGPKKSSDQLRQTSSQDVDGDSNGVATPRPPAAERMGAAIPRPGTGNSQKPTMPLKSILKKTEVEQFSEAASSEAGEDGQSHHTVSESGSGSFDSTGKWHASDYDTSALSEKEMKKLVKKGINPSLYLEMKAAKSGKSCVGALTGNTYA